MHRIAMCDDETEAREALYLLLDQELHEESEQIVYEFSTGTAAANWLQKHPGEIDLLFLDVEMDGMNGMETAKKIRTFDQNLLIVFVTGFADYVFDGYSVGAMDYLMKPVSRGKLQSLLARVREKLGQEEAEEFERFQEEKQKGTKPSFQNILKNRLAVRGLKREFRKERLKDMNQADDLFRKGNN